MTTQSKSVLIPFLIFAAIIFAVALGWKFIAAEDKNTVKPVEVATTESKAPKQASIPPVVEVKQEIEQTTEPVEKIDIAALTIDERKELRSAAATKMTFSIKYGTIEQAINGLEKLREAGQDEMAEKLINFINMQFPNESIPSELLD